MSYIVLARKWRPMVFEDVLGQEHVTRTLVNSLKNQRIAHAYIFAGPRGVGKTTTARLLAKAVNCENQPAINPCNQCASCKSITDGTSLDVIEIDGASNRGIDEIRNLRENIRFAPASSRYKIYIIDEVHMLTKEAFNALLKTLEEPPEHAIFIFATTEIHKVPLTILSRCQRFDFKRIPLAKIMEQLQRIVKAEKIEIDPEALLLISRKADGSMRDAESILDQMISYSDGKISVAQVRESLGIIDQDVYFEFTALFAEKKIADILEFANKIVVSGHDLIDFLHGLQDHFRNLLLVKTLKNVQMLEISDNYKNQYQELAATFSEKDLVHYLQILIDAENEFKLTTFPQLTLEMLLIKLVLKPRAESIEEILAFLEKLKKKPLINLPGSRPAAPASDRISQPLPGSERKPTGYQREPGGEPDKLREGTGSRAQFASLQKKVSSYKSESGPGTVRGTDPTPGDVKELTLEEIRKSWPRIVEEIKAEKIALGSFLQDGVPYQLENGVLTLAYDQKAGFHKEHVAKNKKYIEEKIFRTLGSPVLLTFVTIDFKSQGIEMEPRTVEEILEDIKQKEPIVQKIIDMFGLEKL